jgi:DNA-directed RNA polymerase subunit H (RpoH/RPB5)
MLNARKIEIKNTKFINNENDFWEEYNRKNIILISDDEKTILYIDRSDNFVKDIFTSIMFKNIKKYKNIDKTIIIVDKKITKIIEKYKIDYNKYNIEFLNYSIFYKDPTLHCKVPKHILLNEKEKKEFLECTTTSENKIKKILKSDIISIWYGANKGQIFKIINNGRGNSILTISYRIVI